MNQDASNQGEGPFIPPVSAFAGPIAELVGHRLLSPPTRPGLLASLARFEVVRVLGGGGMGVVVLARDSERGTDVAIKLIKPELVPDQRMVHRFVKEAGHLQKLKHPNVVPVLEVSDRPEGPYFVMPYFERGSLAHRIRPGQPMEADAILDIARQVAEGLGFAHRHGIIHRDLKPANILLGADGRAAWPISAWPGRCSTTLLLTWNAGNWRAPRPTCRPVSPPATRKTPAAIFTPLARCSMKC